jgi:hypothetical protein
MIMMSRSYIPADNIIIAAAAAAAAASTNIRLDIAIVTGDQ